MIELIFSLLLSAPNTDKTYEYCYKPNRCQMVNAVQYNLILIRSNISNFIPDMPTGINCRVKIKLFTNGLVTSIDASNCDPTYSREIIKGVLAASPFYVIPEAYNYFKEFELDVSKGTSY